MSKPIKVMAVVVVAFVKKEKKLDPTSCRPKSDGSCLATLAFYVTSTNIC